MSASAELRDSGLLQPIEDVHPGDPERGRFVFSWWHLVLFPLAILMLLPMIWMLITSFETLNETRHFPPILVPSGVRWQNYRDVLQQAPFTRWFLNTLIVTVVVVVGNLLFCSLAGYAFARIKFFGREVVFILVLATLMIPFQVIMIPTFLIVRKLGLIDTLGALIVPNLAGAFGIFLLRQFFRSLPIELEEAARIDGASRLGVLFKIVLPLSGPVLATVAVITFLWTWNDFLWPLVTIYSPNNMTLQLGLTTFQGAHQTNTHLLMAANVMSVVPVLFLFVIAQRFFIRGIATSGLKGSIMPGLTLDHVSKEFPGGTVAVRDLSLEIADGEFMIFVGPSGCGKTTALRMVAGLEKITSGTIAIGEHVINDETPRDRDIAMVFQNYALYPHMTVRKNLAFGLKERKTPKAEIERRVTEVSAMLGIDDLLKRRPAQLSGGQRQRVAMGRALVREPKAFLMDEPLSNLDAKLRVQVRGDLKRLHQRLGITTIYVTHDQVEAMTLGDRVAVLSNGVLQQLGPPQEVYDHPANLFVAGFIGSPPMNLLRATAASGVATAGDLRVPVPGVPDGDVVLGLRPEHLRPAAEGATGMAFLVDVVEPLGDGVIVHGTVGGQVATTPSGDDEVLPPLPGDRAEITTKFEPELRPTPGETMRLEISPSHVHVFDGRTGDVIAPGSA